MMETELGMLSDQEMIERATMSKDDNTRWIAVEELARRALENEKLLDAACAAIGQDKTINLRYRPYGSYMAIGRILDSGNERAIRRLLHEMDGWTAVEQRDAIAPWAGYKRVAEGTLELVARYNWSPKYLETV